MNLFKEGAESKVYLTEDNKILKLYKTKCCCENDAYEDLNLYYELTQLDNNIDLQIELSKKVQEYVPRIYEKIINYCNHGNAYYGILMEKIDGITYREFLELVQQKKIHYSSDIAIKLVTKLIMAVKSIQDVGYCHNDLNWNNLMILSDYSVKLLDFTLANKLCDEGIYRDYVKGSLLIRGLIDPCIQRPHIFKCDIDSETQSDNALKLWLLGKFIKEKKPCSFKDIALFFCDEQ